MKKVQFVFFIYVFLLAQLSNAQNVTGTWLCEGAYKAEWFQEGQNVYSIYNVGNFKHFWQALGFLRHASGAAGVVHAPAAIESPDSDGQGARPSGPRRPTLKCAMRNVRPQGLPTFSCDLSICCPHFWSRLGHGIESTSSCI